MGRWQPGRVQVILCLSLVASSSCSATELPPPFSAPEPGTSFDARTERADAATTDAQAENVAPTPAVETAVASSAYPRLSHRQWGLAAQALLQLADTPNTANFLQDPTSDTGFDSAGGRLDVSRNLWSDYQAASEALAAEVASDAQKLAKITPGTAPHDARKFVTVLGSRAFRRPLTAQEQDSFVRLFEQGHTLFPGRDTASAGAELVIAALLQSPFFIYRSEQENSQSDDAVITLSDYELAARLSFMLWDTLPDVELTTAAAAGQLHTPEQLRTQAERMLESPLAADKLLLFHTQLLELKRYDALRPSGLPNDIGITLREESERFIRAVIVDETGSFADLFRSSFSFVDRQLANIYGLTGDFDDHFRRVELDPDIRSGLLTQPGFLIAKSGETAPILRGVFVSRKLLCATLPPPPVFTTPIASGTTRRERIDSITGAGTCGAGCHGTIINPAGFPFESFDDSGRYRTEDHGKPVDAHASYPFDDGLKAVSGAVEWSHALADSRQAHECYARHWLEFALARTSGEGDTPLIARLAESSLHEDLPVKGLLTLLVQSTSFRTRRLGTP